MDTSIFTVVTTNIRVAQNASIKCGDNVIVFGTGTHSGVSYVVPSAAPQVGTPIAGEYRAQGFAVAGRKVLLYTDEGRLEIFDPETEANTEIPLSEVTLEGLPDGDDQDRDSPVMADGRWAVTRNAAAQVDDHSVLKLLDLSVDPPEITALPNPPVPISQIAINSAEHVVVTFGGDRFFVYDIHRPEEPPRTIDLSSQGGVTGPFAYDWGCILYIAASSPDNIRVMKVSDGRSVALDTGPAHRLLSVAMRGGRYAYFLNRDADDKYAVVFRAATGELPHTAVRVAGRPGDPSTHTLPWEGFGDDVAITPNGKWIFISGDQVILGSAEFLQVSDGGDFGRFPQGDGYLNASDVDASEHLVAFKTGKNEEITLGYIILP
jgi:hypothetical protein